MIHRDSALQTARPGQRDLAAAEVDPGSRQVEVQCPRGQLYAEVPNAQLGKRLGVPGHAGRQLFTPKIRHVEVAIGIQGDFDVAKFRRSKQHDFPRRHSGELEIHGVVRIGFELPERWVPIAINAKGLGSTEDAIGIAIRRRVAEGEGIRGKERRRRHVGRNRQDYISAEPHLERKKLIRTQGASVGHQERRVVRAQIGEEDIQRHGLSALGGQFVDDASINLARPKQAKMVTERAVLRNALHTFLVNEDKTEVRGGRSREMKRSPGAQIEGHQFEAFEKIGLPNPQEADEDDDAERDQTGCALERLQLHAEEENKKTRATQGCSGLREMIERANHCAGEYSEH